MVPGEQVHVLQDQAELRAQAARSSVRMSSPSMVMRPSCTS
jgi:hypothetical protein